MTKELIISIIIVAIIVTGDILTTKNTNKCIQETKERLLQMEQELQKNNNEIDGQNLKKQMESILSDWRAKHRKLAMYIEHNELEKIETDLSSLNGYLKQEEYGDANAQIDVSIYVLEHIKNKTILNIINIF